MQEILSHLKSLQNTWVLLWIEASPINNTSSKSEPRWKQETASFTVSAEPRGEQVSLYSELLLQHWHPACLNLAQRAQRRASHLLHHDINSNDPPPRLPLRAPISARLRGLLHEANGQPPGSWTITQWTKQWGSANTKLHGYIKTPSTRPARHTLNRNSWVRLNRCRTGHGRFRANMHRMNLCDAPDCPCGAPEQTADHIINDCTKYQCPGLQALSTLNSEALAWLADTSLVI